MAEPRAVIVGEGVGWEEVAHWLGQLGLRAERADADWALSEWKPEDIPAVLILGPSLRLESTAEICRQVKLHDTFNRVPIIELLGGGVPGVPEDSIRIEPDLYLDSGASPVEIAASTRAVVERAHELEAAGIVFRCQVVCGSDLTLLGEIGKLLEPILWLTRLGEGDLERVRYAALEMGLNAIEWGNRWERGRRVRFTFTVTKDRFMAKIADDGPGFDTGEVVRAGEESDPQEQIAARRAAGLRIGGYGVRVAREFVDELHYNEVGNEVTLVKYLPQEHQENSGRAPERDAET